MNSRPSYVITALLSFAICLASCHNVPLVDLSKNFTVQVHEKADNSDPAKIDFVWVIDNSSSMCEEQLNLTKNFQSFIDALDNFINVDARMAVVNTNVLGDHGEFQHEPATAFPPPCRRQKIKKCLKDDDCVTATSGSPALSLAPEGSSWLCDWTNKAADTIENENGSINSRCRLDCDTERREGEEPTASNPDPLPPGSESCHALFGEEFQCVHFSGNVVEPGCMVPPPTTGCPDSLPKYLEKNDQVSNLEYFRCIATVGADPSFNANLEQGLNAARFALDPNGPNAEQAKDFMKGKALANGKFARDDAWLVMVFVSDEEDCSLTSECLVNSSQEWNSAKEVKLCISRDEYNKCAKRRDRNSFDPEASPNIGSACEIKIGNDGSPETTSDTCRQEGLYCRPKAAKIEDYGGERLAGTCEAPLESVNRFVNFFKSLKSDPSRVLVAAIVGDSQAVGAEARDADIALYRLSEEKNKQPGMNPYICKSDDGIADYGERYTELVKGFGANGVLANICGPGSCTTSGGEDGFVDTEGDCLRAEPGTDPATLGIGQALNLISETIIKRVIRVCLPRERKCVEYSLEDPEKCTQKTTLDVCLETSDDCPNSDAEKGISGCACSLKEVETAPGLGEYRVEDDSGCGLTGQAIFFGDVFDPADKIEVWYEGDTGVE